jgi:hypothetical protein
VRRREPEAVLVEGGVLVKHTHDVEVAERLARAAVAQQNDVPEAEVTLTPPLVIWCWIGGVLPGSIGEAEGWGWQYHHADGPRRGVFRAVEFA